MQNNVTIADGKVTGTLYKLSTGQLASDWGEGYFLALKWTDPDEDATSLKVGLDPSMGTGLVECIDDSDRNGVFKIADPTRQVFRVITSAEGGTRTTMQSFDLSGLVLTPEA